MQKVNNKISNKVRKLYNLLMILDIVKNPNPILKQKSQKAPFGEELNKLIKDMIETIENVKNPPAAGLSAVQVGKLWRVMIIVDNLGEIPPTLKNQNQKYLICVNPKVISLSKEKDLDWEGCLSFPNLYGKVWRAKKIKIKYQDEQKREQRLTASGFLARVIQHEFDHLEGITFDTKVVGKLYSAEELENQT